MDEPLETNFGRRSMKELMEITLKKKNNTLHGKKIKTYSFKIKYIKVEMSIHVSREVMVKEIQAIKKLTR